MKKPWRETLLSKPRTALYQTENSRKLPHIYGKLAKAWEEVQAWMKILSSDRTGDRCTTTRTRFLSMIVSGRIKKKKKRKKEEERKISFSSVQCEEEVKTRMRVNTMVSTEQRFFKKTSQKNRPVVLEPGKRRPEPFRIKILGNSGENSPRVI